MVCVQNPMSQPSSPEHAKLRAKLDELEQVVRARYNAAAEQRRAQASLPRVEPENPAEPDGVGAQGNRRGGTGGWLWRLFTGQK
jgi:hypothetical protein